MLSNDGSTLFVAADQGLDCKDYHDPGGSITWENCTLRSWLNSSFYSTAFSSAEQGAVVSQNVVNEDKPDYGTEGGNNTTDKVYLLSSGEVADPSYGFCKTYSTYSASRRLKPSDYAHARGVWTITSSDYAGNCSCWLRSPGGGTDNAARVIYDGYVGRCGNYVFNNFYAVVPALHINLSSDLWSLVDDGSSGAGGEDTSPEIGNEDELHQYEYRIVAVIEGAMYVLNNDVKGRTMYFNSYLSNRGDYGSAEDDIFMTLYRCQYKVI